MFSVCFLMKEISNSGKNTLNIGGELVWRHLISNQRKHFMGLIVYWSIIKFHYISQAVVTDVGVSHYPSVLHYFCSNHWDSNTATQRSSLPVRQNASHSDWCLKLEQGRNYTNKITHLWVIGGCLGWAEAHINHNKDTYWLSVGFTLVMMSERIEGARRCIV